MNSTTCWLLSDLFVLITTKCTKMNFVQLKPCSIFMYPRDGAWKLYIPPNLAVGFWVVIFSTVNLIIFRWPNWIGIRRVGRRSKKYRSGWIWNELFTGYRRSEKASMFLSLWISSNTAKGFTPLSASIPTQVSHYPVISHLGISSVGKRSV